MSDELTSQEMMKIALKASTLVIGVRVLNISPHVDCVYIRFDEDDPHSIMQVLGTVPSSTDGTSPPPTPPSCSSSCAVCARPRPSCAT